jgi:hypothetical protein
MRISSLVPASALRGAIVAALLAGTVATAEDASERPLVSGPHPASLAPLVRAEPQASVDTSSPGLRVAGSVVGGLVATAGVVAGLDLFAAILQNQNHSASFGTMPFLLVATAASSTLVPLGVWLGQQLAGGLAHLGDVVLGGAVGAFGGLGVFLTMVFVGSLFRGHGDLGFISACLPVAAAAGAVIGAGESHDEAVAERTHTSFALTPMPGGGAVVMSVGF